MMMFPVAIMMIEDEDERAFMERVYMEHRQLMYRAAYAVLRDYFSAEDAIGTSCVALCKKISLLRSLDPCKLRAYVVLTCKNTALNALKAKNRQSDRLFYDMDIVGETVASCEDVVEHALRRAEIEELTAALKQLKHKERDILQQKYLMGENDREIAATYGMTEGNVRYYLIQARKHLLLVMKGDEKL